MKTKLFLMLLLLTLGIIYVVQFTDGCKAKSIQISYRVKPVRETARVVARKNYVKPPPDVVFILDKPYRLTSIKVVTVADAATNKYPHALWHLVVKRNIEPMMDLVYSHPILGMGPDIPNTRAEPLVPGVEYRLLLEDENKVQGRKDFKIK